MFLVYSSKPISSSALLVPLTSSSSDAKTVITDIPVVAKKKRERRKRSKNMSRLVDKDPQNPPLKFEVMSQRKVWRECSAVKASEDNQQWLIHYTGYGGVHNEWIDVQSVRIKVTVAMEKASNKKKILLKNRPIFKEEFVIDRIVSSLKVQTFADLADDHPIKSIYLRNKFLKVIETDSSEVELKVDESVEDAKVEQSIADPKVEIESVSTNVESLTVSPVLVDDTQAVEEQTIVSEDSKIVTDTASENVNTSTEEEIAAGPESKLEEKQNESKSEESKQEEKSAVKTMIKYELLPAVVEHFEQLLFKRTEKSRDELLTAQQLAPLFEVPDANNTQAQHILALQQILFSILTERELVDVEFSWTQAKEVLVSAIVDKPFAFMQWIFASGLGIDFEICFHPHFQTAVEQQFEIQNALASASSSNLRRFNNNLLRLANDLSTNMGFTSLSSFPARNLRHVTDEREVEEYPYRKILFEYSDKLPIESLRLRLAFVQQCNVIAQQILPFVDFRRFHSQSSISNVICHEAESLVFSRIKLDFLQNVCNDTAENVDMNDRPKIVLNRMKMSNKSSSDFLCDTNFAAGFKQIFDVVDTFLLRPTRPHSTEPFVSFDVKLVGQYVEGTAGPYRQYFNDIGREVQSENSLLFMKCPNAREVEHKVDVHVMNAYKYMIRPGIPNNMKDRINETEHLKMFEFLGLLFGCCIRTGVRVPLNLCPFVWKALAHETPTDKDLEKFDKSTYDFLMKMKKMNKEQFSKMFGIENAKQKSAIDVNDVKSDGDGEEINDMLQEIEDSKLRYFNCQLGDNENVIELVANGDNIPLTFANREEYIQKVFYHRLREHNAMIESIRRGIDKIVPISALNVLNWYELEVLISGKKEINIELLRRHTVYANGVSSGAVYIQWFWEILTAFSAENRIRFIRFAWAQERLPADDEEFEQNKTRLQIKRSVSSKTDKDDLLPKADTCFFNIELPEYSSKALMKEKLLLAITMSISMNADNPEALQ